MPAYFIKNPRCVFIHNPKTGGTTLRKLFMADGGFDGPLTGQLPDDWAQEFSFGFVRNPFDRLVSAWKMFSLGIDDTGWRVPEDLEAGMDLLSFMHIAFDESIPYCIGTRYGKGRIRNHTLPQTHEVYSLAQAKFIGRFENYNDDVNTIFAHLGLASRTLPKRNVSKRGPYQKYFNDQTRAMAEAFYAEDLKIFGYAF